MIIIRLIIHSSYDTRSQLYDIYLNHNQHKTLDATLSISLSLGVAGTIRLASWSKALHV